MSLPVVVGVWEGVITCGCGGEWVSSPVVVRVWEGVITCGCEGG